MIADLAERDKTWLGAAAWWTLGKLDTVRSTMERDPDKRLRWASQAFTDWERVGAVRVDEGVPLVLCGSRSELCDQILQRQGDPLVTSIVPPYRYLSAAAVTLAFHYLTHKRDRTKVEYYLNRASSIVHSARPSGGPCDQRHLNLAICSIAARTLR
ncbi:MAG: hypothetical protein LC749_14060, partial [Actinobacteria bacterium]|nr:hypothetical protein [Actinomycetota bacterium]